MGRTVSIRPGPWWLKPLWSLRQQVDVSSTLSDEMGTRQSRASVCCSHFMCWMSIEAVIIAKAS